MVTVKIDNDLADDAIKAGCLSCGGKLHQADYPRSPHGLSEADAEHYQFRRSVCCGKCRKRHTPPSVRFFGRRWYVAPVCIRPQVLSAIFYFHPLRNFESLIFLHQHVWLRCSAG